MKTTLTLILILSALAVSAQSGDWETLSIPTGTTITGIVFCHPDTGYFVTHDGRLGYTYDGARSWRMREVDRGLPLEDVYFRNSDTGYVCGRSGALRRTIDGGLTWENVSPLDTMPWLLSVRMSDSKHGAATGMKRSPGARLAGLMLVTDDGGKSWQAKDVPGVGFGELFLSSRGALYFQSYGKLHMSRDGGQTWKTAPTLEGRPGRATAIVGKTGVLVGNSGMAAYSHDNGKVWLESQLDPKIHFTSVVMVNDSSGYAAGTEGTVMMTFTGGKVWTADAPDVSFDIYALALAGDYLYAVGTEGNVIRKKIK